MPLEDSTVGGGLTEVAPDVQEQVPGVIREAAVVLDRYVCLCMKRSDVVDDLADPAWKVVDVDGHGPLAVALGFCLALATLDQFDIDGLGDLEIVRDLDLDQGVSIFDQEPDVAAASPVKLQDPVAGVIARD